MTQITIILQDSHESSTKKPPDNYTEPVEDIQGEDRQRFKRRSKSVTPENIVRRKSNADRRLSNNLLSVPETHEKNAENEQRRQSRNRLSVPGEFDRRASNSERRRSTKAVFGNDERRKSINTQRRQSGDVYGYRPPASLQVSHQVRRLSNVRWARWGRRMSGFLQGTSPNFSDDEETEEDPEPKEKPIEIWRRKIRIVRMLCGVCMTLRKYAMEAGLMSNIVLPVARRAHVGSRGDIIDFNLDDFRVQKEVPVPLCTIDLMEKPPQQRTEEDVQQIVRCMRNLPSFRKYTTEMQLMMAKIVRYMRCSKRRVVLRKGHQGYSVYFLFTGSVSVVMDTENDSVFVKPEVVILRRGACFGEIALLQNTNRNATVVTAEECEFLVVDKEDFIENGIHLRMKDEFNYRLDFFSKWPSLHSLDEEHIRTLAYCSRSEDFGYNKVIIKDSRKNEWLWFIVKGTCEVLKLVKLNSCPEQMQTIKTLKCGSARFLTSSTDEFSNTNERKLSRCKSASLSRRKWKEPLTEQNRPSLSRATTFENGDLEEHVIENGEAPKMRFNSFFKVSEDILNDDKSPGIYVKVDRMRDGMCFGLDALFESSESARNEKEQYSLISKGCTLIHVPRSRFLELANDKCLSNIRRELQEYPSERELVDKFVANSAWETYKQGLVEEVVLKRLNPSALRSDNVKKYMEKVEPQNNDYGAGLLSSREPQPTPHKLNQRLKSASETTERSRRTANTSFRSTYADSSNNTTLTSASEAELIMDTRRQKASYRPLTCPTAVISKRERLRMILKARAQERDKWTTKMDSNETSDRRAASAVQRSKSVAVKSPSNKEQISLKYNANDRAMLNVSSASATSQKLAARLARTGFKSSSFAARNNKNNTSAGVSFKSSSEVIDSSSASRYLNGQSNSDTVFGPPIPGTRVKSAYVKRDYSVKQEHQEKHRDSITRPKTSSLKSHSYFP